MKAIASLVKRTVISAFSGFGDDELMTRAAALAFYASVSFAPILILLVWMLSLLHSDGQQQLAAMLTGMIGSSAADAIQAVVSSAREHPRAGNMAGLVGIGVTLVGASSVFAQLQGSLNRIWGVEAQPGNAIGAWLRARARGLALLGGIGFMMIVTFVVSAVLQLVVPGDTWMWATIEYVFSAAVFVLAFGAMYRVLPDAHIHWRDALRGGALTALLFLAGKWVIGLYISHSDVGGAYGSAGALVVLLTWVFYASVIVLMGAELTHSLMVARGERAQPAEHASKDVSG
ncbi:YihY/virulence factor BrkB family protein [Rhodanobacter sp. AS-Z3]|uniref:YihY/virulence factor BrkB family protein n=1 Tax=Rhodanobacter sp. AS-Z3 TaxID=3031330 RepID=UPI0024783550|nr:YihY/virulence factor BrkB family protein [Rhodanobacter sp. AS-Z3]WEN14222.1 YihY/virulence factor BrkB family protein [Rhodanobacter sp. AS-Z3]